MKTVKDVIDNTTILVDERVFDIFTSKEFYPEAFACIKDRNELTVIALQDSYKFEDALKIEKGWRLITFDTVIEFSVVGFLARVSEAIAKRGISIFAISSYSTDHILVREGALSDAIEALKELGFTVTS